jgi:hypothetical protein
MLTPREIVDRLGRTEDGKNKVGIHKVLGWLRSGQLKASNVGDGKTKRWLADEEDLEAFLAARRNTPAVKARRATKRPKVTEYF